MATQNVCRFNKYGYCKHMENCRNLHVNDVCGDSSCDVSKCTRRHPRTCKFYSEFKRCKFDPCAYKHITNDDDIDKLKKENQELLGKLDAIERDLKKLAEKEIESKSIIEKLNILEEKYSNLGSKENEITQKDERNLVKRKIFFNELRN